MEKINLSKIIEDETREGAVEDKVGAKPLNPDDFKIKKIIKEAPPLSRHREIMERLKNMKRPRSGKKTEDEQREAA